jgi:NADH:ubiquinone oxidoreductase subunit F (NADH-binding)/(2Fe-2S) ferredoxin/NAD-dependent dihydropyrimidine dehydrogenase PreA subunit
MVRISSNKDLDNIKERTLANLTERARKCTLLICGGAGCISSNSTEVKNALTKELADLGVAGVRVVETGCIGCCDLGPVIVVQPEGILYQRLKPQDIKEIVQNHLLNGKVVERLIYKNPHDGQLIPKMADLDFFKYQTKVILSNCGSIDPTSIEEYIARDGYFALHKALFTMNQNAVIDEVKASGLRGRGGAGFTTGTKWLFTRQAKGDIKYVVGNADEGDPGAFMDRSLLEGDPHSVIEGIIIAGFAVGAHQGYIYVRAEYPLAVERLRMALDKAREFGLLGINILASGFDFDIDLRLGAGAFVCGEETALLLSVEGKRGTPRPRPPFPAQEGLYRKPTLLNNVETFANIPLIILKGAKSYTRLGTEKSKGTKMYSLAGKVVNTGLIEVPIGTPIRKIVFEIGGGCPGGKKFKAIQTGGPSGGCIPEDRLETPMDYETVKSLGSIMGSGGLVVMDEDDCMVDIARFFLDFTVDESCGKCTPCREGNMRMLEILTRIVGGKGKEGDIELLETLSENIRSASLCGLGQTAPNPVLTTLRYFRDEYIAHVMEKRCPAQHCKALLGYIILTEKCQTCGACLEACPAQAINKIKTTAGQTRFYIVKSKCTKCGSCKGMCQYDAVALR